MAKEKLINGCRLELVEGDITKQAMDAIGNAANSGLRGGGGVDGAIHRAGGPSLMAECRKIGSCRTGSAVITGGGKLSAKHVLHAVGPVYRGGNHGEAELLASCYRTCLALAMEHNLGSVAFPSISTGVYGYPIADAAEVALKTVAEFLSRNGKPSLVRFVLFGKDALAVYATALDKVEA